MIVHILKGQHKKVYINKIKVCFKKYAYLITEKTHN